MRRSGKNLNNRRKSAHPADVPWWKPTLLTRNPDRIQYLLWQIGLLLTALSLLYVILLFQGLPVDNPDVIDQAILVSLSVDAVVCGILWYLITERWSRSKRFALGFMLLADVLAKLLLLEAAQPDAAPFDSGWYLALVVGVALYVLGTGLIGLIVWFRGDTVSPWWK